VFSLGKFWTNDDDHWLPLDADKVAVNAGQWFGGFKFC